MACNDCNSGLFLNTVFNWNSIGTTDVILPNGTTITRTGASSLSVFKGAANQLFNAPSAGQVHYYNWGTPANYLAILTVEGGASGTRSVVIINTETSSLETEQVVFISASSATPLPIINHCAGAGGAIITKASNGSQLTASMWTSDNGTALCSAGSFTATLEVNGNATATQLQILHGASVVASCAKPAPDCRVSPLSAGKVVFPDAVTGAGVDPSLSSTTKQITITNNGNNCLRVDSISNSASFARIAGSESKPFPVTLQAGQNFHFDARFTPATVAVSTTINETMAINPTPAATHTSIQCRGTARPPHLTLTFNAISFGNVPVGTTATRTLQIQNTGEAALIINVPPPPAGIAYTWTPPPASLAAGATASMVITFSPLVEGPDNRTLTFTSNATGSPHTVNITGTGCIARAAIQLPNTGPVVLGNVQQGYRTVRSFKVLNTGNGALVFSARIVASSPGDSASEADALQFGLLENNTVPVTNPPATITGHTIPPVTICGSGATGTGEYVFGIAFFSTGTLRTVNARLQIFNHNDTTSGAPASFMISLSATVTNPISVDVELVLDRSGSMADPSGSRTKIETARDAARLFIALSRADVADRIGLVRFNNTPDLVLVNGNSIQEITTANHTAIENAVNATNFSATGGTTVAGGVMVAQKDIVTHPRTTAPTELRKIIIVLTDGIDNVPYLNPDDGIKYSLLGGLVAGSTFPFLPESTTALPVPADMKIYAIGIGDNIDTGRLGTLSTSTGGVFLQAKEFSGQDFFNLEKHFTQVYMEAVDYAQISDPVFTINPGETQEFDFEVLDGDKSAIVVIYDKDGLRIPFFIVSPAGEIFDLVSLPSGFSMRPGITATARFIEINMPQGEPDRYAGTWKVFVKHDRRACSSKNDNNDQPTHTQKPDDEFGSGFQPKKCRDNYDIPILYGIAIGVGSNFNMVPFVTPGIVRIGEPIQITAMVSEFGLPVTNCIVTVVAARPNGTTTTHTLFDNGAHGDDQPDDGTYGLAYIHTAMEGTYTFTFTCTGLSRDGKPMKREGVRSKYVEGRVPLVTDDNGGNNGRDDKEDACCKNNLQMLRILVVVAFIILLLLIVLLIRM